MRIILIRCYSLVIPLFFTTVLLAQSVEQQADSILLLIKQSTKIDTNTIEQYNALTGLYLFNNPATSLKYAQKALQIAKEKNTNEQLRTLMVTFFFVIFIWVLMQTLC